MKVAVFSPYRTVSPHYETELEIAQQHIDAGDMVEFINCTGELACCDFNSSHEDEKCRDCRGRRAMGLDLIDIGKEHGVSVSGFSDYEETLPEFDSMDALKEFRIDNFDLGYAALSSLVSIIRDPEPDLVEHRELLNRFLRAGATVYRNTLANIRVHQPERVYVFNGRFAAMRAVLRACQMQNTDCFMHERGCDNQHFEVLKNHLVHEIPATVQNICERWVEADPKMRDEIGASWFLDRIGRVEKNWTSFVKSQDQGKLPDGWDNARRNIVIFSSSDDEFVAIGDCWTNHLYENQVEAVQEIAESMQVAAPDVHLYLRVHPNQKKIDNARKRAMMTLDLENLTVIRPESPIDSYAMLLACDTVVSFGSSIGIEGVFHGKPSVLLGPCFYRDLGGVYRPEDHNAAIDLLSRTLEPLEKTGALMYGHWLQTRGMQHQYYQPNGLFEGTFKGHVIYDRTAESECSNSGLSSSPRSWPGKLKRETRRLIRQVSDRMKRPDGISSD